MRTLCILLVAIWQFLPANSSGESIDGRVVQILLPVEDVTLSYLEAKGGMALELKTETTSVIGTRFYIGDGNIALELEADSLKGIFFQGKTPLKHGHQFKKYSVVEVLPGYQQAASLKPGDVYITLPAINFKLPK